MGHRDAKEVLISLLTLLDDILRALQTTEQPLKCSTFSMPRWRNGRRCPNSLLARFERFLQIHMARYCCARLTYAWAAYAHVRMPSNLNVCPFSVAPPGPEPERVEEPLGGKQKTTMVRCGSNMPLAFGM